MAELRFVPVPTMTLPARRGYSGTVEVVPHRPASTAGSRTDRHELILQAAMTCYARRGVAGTRMDDIASEAGIPRTVLYRFFAGKDALQLAVMVRHIEQRASQLHTAHPPRGPAAPLILHALLMGIVEPSADRVAETVLAPEVLRDTAKLMVGSAEIADAMRAYWAPYLDHAVARGELRPGVNVAAAVQWLTTIVFLHLAVPEVVPPREVLVRQLEAFVVPAVVSDPR
jgi:AcrR family transcriptional regulator